MAKRKVLIISGCDNRIDGISVNCARMFKFFPDSCHSLACAEDKLKETNYDLVVVDDKTDDASMFQIVRCVKDTNPSATIIVSTNCRDSGEVIMDDGVQLVVRPYQLWQTIQTELKRSYNVVAESRH